MRKSTIIFLVGALGALIVVPLLVLQLAPSGDAWLRGALFKARAIREQAVIARKLAENGSPESLDALEKFAETKRHVAFDRRRRLTLIYDAGDRRTHVAGPSGHGGPETFVTGTPPVAFEGVLLVESEPERTTFLMKVEATGAFQTIQFRYAGGRLESSGFYDPDAEQVRAWRKSVTWPAGW
jgi:hypothetical protein